MFAAILLLDTMVFFLNILTTPEAKILTLDEMSKIIT